MREFCPRCGLEERLTDGLCKSCFAETRSYIHIPDRLELLQCAKCDRWKHGNKWGTLEDAVKGRIKVNGVLESFGVEKEGNRLAIEAVLMHSGLRIKEKSRITASIRKITCDVCSKLSGGYYEAVLQLRGAWKNATSYVNTGGVSKIEHKKEGLDFYFISMSDARNNAKRIISKFGGKLKETYTLAGEKNGKRLYRQTILVRIDDV